MIGGWIEVCGQCLDEKMILMSNCIKSGAVNFGTDKEVVLRFMAMETCSYVGRV